MDTFEQILWTPPHFDELMTENNEPLELEDIEKLMGDVLRFLDLRQPGAIVWAVQQFVDDKSLTVARWKAICRKLLMGTDRLASWRAWIKFERVWTLVWIFAPVDQSPEPARVPGVLTSLSISKRKLCKALKALDERVRKWFDVYFELESGVTVSDDAVDTTAMQQMLTFLLTDSSTLPTISAMSASIRMYDRARPPVLGVPSMMLTLTSAALNHCADPAEIDMTDLYTIMSCFKGATLKLPKKTAGKVHTFDMYTIGPSFDETWGMLFMGISEWETLDDDARRAIRYTAWKCAMQGMVLPWEWLDKTMWAFAPPLAMAVLDAHRTTNVPEEVPEDPFATV